MQLKTRIEVDQNTFNIYLHICSAFRNSLLIAATTAKLLWFDHLLPIAQSPLQPIHIHPRNDRHISHTVHFVQVIVIITLQPDLNCSNGCTQHSEPGKSFGPTMAWQSLTLNPIEAQSAISGLGKGLAKQNVLPHRGVENPGLLWREGDWLLPGDLPSHEMNQNKFCMKYRKIREFIYTRIHWYLLIFIEGSKLLRLSIKMVRRLAPGQVLKSPCEASRLQLTPFTRKGWIFFMRTLDIHRL